MRHTRIYVLVTAIALALGTVVFAEGTGFWLGGALAGGKMSVGVCPGGPCMKFDGSALSVVGGTITSAVIKTAPTGARAQMDGTSLKSIDASDNTLVEMDGSGVRITPDTTFQVARMYGFAGSLIGLGYATSPNNVLALWTDDDVQISKYSSGLVWSHTFADKALYPAGSDYSIGTLANPYADMYGGIYHSKISGTTYDGMTKTCGGGSDFVQDITIKGGVVVDVNCAAPGPVPASDLAALKARVSGLEALVNRLLAAGAK
jgi:hypothetical protein